MDWLHSVRKTTAPLRSAFRDDRHGKSTRRGLELSLLRQSRVGFALSRAAHLRSTFGETKTNDRRLSKDSGRRLLDCRCQLRACRREEFAWERRLPACISYH